MPQNFIGEFLAKKRKSLGLTQQEVADQLNISNKTLSSWESGRSYPDILILPALAKIYGVTVDEILSGDRPSSKTTPDEMPQEALFQNAANRYSVKCTTLSGIGLGGVGLFVLALFLGFVANWLFLLFAILSLLTEITVIILFVVFEKSALLLENRPSRYSLIIKHMTYRAAFKIVCALLVPAVVFLFVFHRVIDFGLVTMRLFVPIVSLVFLALAALFLCYLSRRGKEFLTQEESAARSHNRKCAVKLFLIGIGCAAVLFVVSSVLSGLPFTHTEKSIDLPKDEFLRLIQTIEVSSDDAAEYQIKPDGDGADYFVDVKAALSNPVEMDLFGKQGNIYHIEGNLYFSYLIDYEANNSCYLSYIPDLSETFRVTFCFGSIWFRDQTQFKAQYPDPTAQDLLSGIESEEVFFVLNQNFSGEVSTTTNGLGGFRYYSDRFVEASDDHYALVRKVEQNFPWIALLGDALIVAEITVCIVFYRKKRTKLDLCLSVQ